MPRILAVVNQKGGVGKTTTTVNLAAALAQAGRRVLLVDLDPQGNATMGSGVDKRNVARTVYHALLGLGELAGIRTRAERGGYDLVPANRELAGAEVELVELPARETRLKSALERVAADYDFILIDCPPSLSLLTVNALAAAQRVLIPMQCEYYALEGLSDLVGTIKRVRANLNPSLEIAGLLRTMYDPRNTLSQQVSQQLEAHFGDKVYRTLVPRNVRLAEAPSYGVPAVVWDATSKGAQAYIALADEVLEREVLTHESKRPGPGPGRAARRQRGAAARSAADAAGRAHPPGPLSAADQDGPAGAGGARRLDPLAGPDAAAAGAAGRPRPLRADRRRAALARRADGGPGRSAGAGARSPRRRRARHVADREHPAREPESDGRGRRPAAAGRRIQDDARAGRRRGRPLAQRRRPTCCACSSCRARCRKC